MAAIALSILSGAWSLIKPYLSQILAFFGGYRSAIKTQELKSESLANEVTQQVKSAQADEPKSVTELRENVLLKGKF